MIGNNTNNIRCWLWFAMNQQEELYEVISAMIKDKISELLPQMIEEQLRQQIEKLSVNINTTINGKAATYDSLNNAIYDMIKKELKL